MKLRNSIAAKFTGVLLVVLLLGQGAGVYLFLRYTRATLLEALHERTERLSRQSAGILAEPLLNYNFSVIEAYLKESLQDRDLVSMQVLDQNKAVVSRQGGDKKGLFTTSSPIMNGESAIGEIRIDYSAQTVDEWLDRNLVIIPLFQFLLLAAVAGFLVLMVRLYIRRPVAKLNDVLARITSGDLAAEFPPFARDDIGTLADGIRFLADRLAATVTRIHSISENASSAISLLHRTSAQVTGVVQTQEGSISEVTNAVRSASDSQRQIVASTEELLSLSSDNSSALLELRASSEEIAGSAENLRGSLDSSHAALAQLTQSAGQVNRMAEEVSRSVEGSSSSVEEIYRSVQEIGSSVRESSKLSSLTSTAIAEKGMTAVQDTAEGMERIESFMQNLTGAIEGIGGRSKDIGNVLAVIAEVTEQLQLLSLNAQIIAAQAGAHGQGFAVVAHEMRELSDRTAGSTREIGQIVSGFQSEILGVVQGAREMVEVVRASGRIVNQAGDVFQEIHHSSAKAADMAQRIDRASQEQTRGLEMIVGAIERIRNGIAEVNKATREQEKSATLLLNTLGCIRETMAMTQNATQEQTRNLQFLADNLTQANAKTSGITESSLNQEAINQQILRATEDLLRMAGNTATQVESYSGPLSSLHEEIRLLQDELRQFQTRNAPIPHPGAAGSRPPGPACHPAPTRHTGKKGVEAGDGHEQNLHLSEL